MSSFVNPRRFNVTPMTDQQRAALRADLPHTLDSGPCGPVLMPSPQGDGPCECGHEAREHWLGEPGGCEGRGCSCVTYTYTSESEQD